MARDYDPVYKRFYQWLFQRWDVPIETEVEVFQRAKKIDAVVRCTPKQLKRLRGTVFEFFRRLNVLELKSLLDLLNLAGYNRIMMRAWGLGALQKGRADQLPSNRTVTIICVTRPHLILDTLRSELGFEATDEPGIYFSNQIIPQRIIYPTELELIPKNYPLLVLAKGEKLTAFFEEAVRQSLDEYVEVILEVGVNIDPEALMAGVDKMSEAHPQVSKETFERAVEVMWKLVQRRPQYTERMFEVIQEIVDKVPEYAERMTFVKAQRIRGEQQMLLRQLRAKFPNLPDRVVRQVEAITDEEALDTLAERIVTAQTLAEIGLGNATRKEGRVAT